MLFKDYLKKLLQNEEFRKKWDTYQKEKEFKKVNENMKLKKEFIPNDFGFDCPKCHSKKYVQIEDGENGYGNPEYHFECKDCGYVSEVSEIDSEDLDEVYQQDIILDEDIKEIEYNVIIDNIEWSAENEDLPSAIQHDFFLSPYDNLEDEVYKFLLDYSNGVAPLGYSIDYNQEDYYIKDDDYIGDEDNAYHTESLDDEYWSSEENPLDDRYDYIDSKMVYDSDGMMTEYTMYYDTLDNKYVFVFGDSDLYKPEDEDFDWECETRDEAEQWFRNYKGFEDDLDECNLKEAQGQNLYLKLRDEIKNSNNVKYLKNLDKKLVDEYLKSLNVDEKQALHHYIVLQIRKINDKALNEARDYESEYNITPVDKKKIIQWWKDLDKYYKTTGSKSYVAGIDEIDSTDEIDGWLDTMFDVLLDLVDEKKDSLEALDLLRRGKALFNKYSKYSYFNYGVKESKQLNEKDYYADKTIGRYKIYPSRRTIKLKQQDGRNYGSIGSRPYVEFEDIILTWKDIDGMDVNHADIFEWFKAFKDGRVDKALDNKLNNSQNNKSLKEDFEEVVKDSYKHFTDDLGVTPSIDDIFEDIIKNYEGYEDEDSTPEKSAQFYKDIRYWLIHLDLPYKDLDESLNEAKVHLKEWNTGDSDCDGLSYAKAIEKTRAENEKKLNNLIKDNNIKVNQNATEPGYAGTFTRYSGVYNGHQFTLDLNKEHFTHWIKNLIIDNKLVNLYKSSIGNIKLSQNNYWGILDLPKLLADENIKNYIYYADNDYSYLKYRILSAKSKNELSKIKKDIINYFKNNQLTKSNVKLLNYYLGKDNSIKINFDESLKESDTDKKASLKMDAYDLRDIFGRYYDKGLKDEYNLDVKDFAFFGDVEVIGKKADIERFLEEKKLLISDAPSSGYKKEDIKIIDEDESLKEDYKEDKIKRINDYFDAWGWPCYDEIQDVIDFYRLDKDATLRTLGQQEKYKDINFDDYKYYNMDESLKEDYFDDKEFITLPEEEQKQFEQLMNDNGWVLDDETSRYGSKNFYDAWFHKKGDGAQDIHYQFITKDTLTEDEWDELMDNTFDLLDECEKEYNTRIRFSAGLINDGSKYNGRGTIGIDIDAPELIVNGDDKVPAELAGHKIRLKNGKPHGEDSKKVIKDIEDHGFDTSMMGIKKDESLKKERITEGCWSCPNTVQKAKELVNLLSKPLLASEATDKLYNLLGDDKLFDNIEDYENEEGPDYDVRFLVKDWIIDNILKNKNDIKWYTKFDTKAINILKNALKKDKDIYNIDESLKESPTRVKRK